MKKGKTSFVWFIVVGILFGMVGYVVAQGIGAEADASVLTAFVLALLGAAGAAVFFGGK